MTQVANGVGIRCQPLQMIIESTLSGQAAQTLKQQHRVVMKKKYCVNSSRLLNTRVNLKSQFADNLTKKKIIFTYETLSIDYEITCTYRPDFILNNFIVETKSYFSKEDRRKHLIIKATRPELDIRFCFQNSRTKLSKTKNSISYAKWCERHGFQYCDKFIPDDWYEEPIQNKNSLP